MNKKGKQMCIIVHIIEAPCLMSLKVQPNLWKMSKFYCFMQTVNPSEIIVDFA